ncbi:MAG: hypothetical protein KJP00_07560 [Bacteroidia bacterium]|nr:hypothetical protein [Bacteroidia bacterium]
MKLFCLLLLLALSYFFNPIAPIVSESPAIDLTINQPSIDKPETIDASLLNEVRAAITV